MGRCAVEIVPSGADEAGAGQLRACQTMLGHSSITSTPRNIRCLPVMSNGSFVRRAADEHIQPSPLCYNDALKCCIATSHVKTNGSNGPKAARVRKGGKRTFAALANNRLCFTETGLSLMVEDTLSTNYRLANIGPKRFHQSGPSHG